jgi:uncharacterized membrane protein YphA (DoxX/SURF4 family)
MGTYFLAFSRIVIGLVFALSFAGKIRDINSFEQTITRFQLLPEQLSRASAFFFLGGELAVVIANLIGGPFLLWGFLLAVILLAAFSVAIASVLIRKIHTSCNCFGLSEKPVSREDLVRNAGFIACALSGYGILVISGKEPASLGLLEWGLMMVMAAFVVTVWIQMGEIMKLLR